MTEKVFDLDEGEFLKEVGKAQAAHSRAEVLSAGKRFAKLIALGRPTRIVNADDVYAALLKSGYQEKELGPAAGSLFKGKNWEYVGMIPSQRKGNHGRRIMVWKWVGTEQEDLDIA